MKLKSRILIACFLCIIFITIFVIFNFFEKETKVIINAKKSKNSKREFEQRKHRDVKVMNSRFISSIKFNVETKRNRTLTDLFRVNHEFEKKAKIIVERLKYNLSFRKQFNESQLWKMAAKWVKSRQIIPENNPQLGSVLKALTSSEIIAADVTRKGTQLKLLLTLKGGQTVFFKPKRYAINDVIKGTPYAGFDRHNGEIAAFHLSMLLGLRFVPIASGRRINVEQELKPFASLNLLKTFLNNGSSNCFFGNCFYCNEKAFVCPEESGILDGVMILHLPSHYILQQQRNPWQRTYKDEVLAKWETDENYCFNKVLKSTAIRPRLLDMIDTSIFDYLIGNADRHHFEVFKGMSNSAIILVDNGKSFGNPYLDEFTILAPLYQCCFMRNTTYQRLLLFVATKKRLSGALNELLVEDILYPILSETHLEAIDRRVETVIALISLCLENKSVAQVLL